jgi:hypothetical protein
VSWNNFGPAWVGARASSSLWFVLDEVQSQEFLANGTIGLAGYCSRPGFETLKR